MILIMMMISTISDQYYECDEYYDNYYAHPALQAPLLLLFLRCSQDLSEGLK